MVPHKKAISKKKKKPTSKIRKISRFLSSGSPYPPASPVSVICHLLHHDLSHCDDLSTWTWPILGERAQWEEGGGASHLGPLRNLEMQTRGMLGRALNTQTRKVGFFWQELGSY